MRIAIIGLGGVGGYLAAVLSKAGLDVTGFARGEHLREIQNQGIKIVEDDKEWQADFEAKELREAEGVFDIVMFCVKSYDLVQSYYEIEPCESENTLLIPFANGVNNGELLREIAKGEVVDGAVYILSAIEKAGVIRKKGIIFSVIFPKENTKILKEVFEASGLRYKVVDDITTALWKKYIFIAAFATLTTYYDTTIGDIYENHYQEAKKLLEEIATFAQENKNIDIFEDVQKALQTAQSLPYNSSTSMHLDFKNGKKTELKNLSGYVQKPFMQKLYNELKKRA
jgi:2-dehydropantoate 2-reductase